MTSFLQKPENEPLELTALLEPLGKFIPEWNRFYRSDPTRLCFFIFGCAGSSLLCRLFSSCCERGCSLVDVLGLLIVVASLVAERGLQGTQASVCPQVCSVIVVPRLWSTSSAVVMHRLSCSMACRIFPDQEWLLLPAMSSTIPHSGGSNKQHVGIQSVPIHFNCACWFKGEERNSKGRHSVFPGFSGMKGNQVSLLEDSCCLFQNEAATCVLI